MEKYSTILFDEHLLKTGGDQIENLLSYLKQKYLLYVLTHTSPEIMNEDIFYKKIKTYIEGFLFHDDVELPLFLQSKIEEPEKTIYVDDDLGHLYSVDRIHLKTCYYHHYMNDCIDFLPDMEVKSVKQLQKIL